MEEFKYLIPEESNDATRMDASLMRTIEGHLRRTFNAHEYQELLLPTFEYADLLSGFGTNEETMFQFINHEGKRITLRTDFTVPIARIYSNAHTDEVRRYRRYIVPRLVIKVEVQNCSRVVLSYLVFLDVREIRSAYH